MKNQVLCLLVLLMLSNTVISENNTYRVIRGERPPVDYDKIPENAYEKGVIVIKFNQEFERHLEENPFTRSSQGHIMFHMDYVDRLNAEYGVHSASQHFLSPALKNTFSERHRAWGFHLWYKLKVDPEANLIDLVKQYSSLRQVEVAELVLKKELIGSHHDKDFHVIDLHSGSAKSWIPDDPQFPSQWHYHNTGQQGGTPGADIRMPAAWELQKGDPAVIVAIQDGGIDYNHPDLAGNMWESIGYNFVTNSPTIQPHNHGTHVAGTIAAVNNNNTGVSGIAGGSGINDGVRLMSAQVFTQSSNGGFHLAPVYSADNGAAISQNSWGYTSPNYYEQSVLDAIDYFNENGGGEAMDGGITIYAAGNSNSSSPYYPGYYSGTLAVAATNNNDAKAWYSNYGAHIDISAPGGETNTVTERGVLSTLNNNTYGYYQGTSMACPHASGVVALMISTAYGEFSPEDVKDILINTVDDHYGSNPGFPGQLGAGRLNAYLAVALSEIYLTLPGNPHNFEAQPVSDSQINLSWELNAESHPIMLAWSPDGVFGIPEEGTIYPPGQSIAGGGTILYSGTGLSFEHTGLQASTPYYYKLWSVDPQTAYSLGRSKSTRTLCGVSPIPFSENFSGSGIPYCWEFPLGQGNWNISSSYGNPSPSMVFNWSPSLSNYSYALESPPLDGDISGEGIALQFDLMLDNYSTSTLEKMIIQVFNGSQWVDVTQFTNAAGDIPWDTHLLDVSEHAQGNNFMVRFVASGVNSYNINRWAIDNFAVFSASCLPPSNLQASAITATSALISWEAGAGQQNWDLAYGTQGFNPDTGGTLVEDITQTNFLIDNLQGVNIYDVYVRTSCGSSETSLWRGPLTFSTLCDIVTLPFSETFSGASPSCWSFTPEQGNWGFGSSYAPPSSQSGAPYATFTWNPTATSYSYSLVSPVMQSLSASSAVKMDYILFLNNFDNNNLEQMAVEFKPWESDEWLLLENFTNAGLGGGNTEHVKVGIEIPGVQGQQFQIRFRAYGQNSYSINGWSVDDINIYQDVTQSVVQVNVILEGAYNQGQNGLMHTILRDNDYLPPAQPFAPSLPYHGNSTPLWYYQGNEMTDDMPDNVVDWVLLELRDAPTPEQAFSTTVVGRQAALLLNTGEITGVNGMPPSFDVEVQQNLFIVVYHRNHLPVMSSEALPLQEGIYLWDFTQGSDKAWTAAEKQAYQQGQKHLGNGLYGMFGGDATGNGQVQTQDKNDAWDPFSGQSGYFAGDFDMNGQVQTQDLNNIWNPNGGLATQVPAEPLSSNRE